MTCQRDRTARLTAPCHNIKNFNVKTLTFANPDDDANAHPDMGGSTIALPGLRQGELKMNGYFIREIQSTTFLFLFFSAFSTRGIK